MNSRDLKTERLLYYDVDVVIIGEEGCEHSTNHDKIFVNAARKVVSYANAISTIAPNAIIILAASPLNSLFPLLTKVLAENGTCNCKKIFGSTAADNICANCALAYHLKIDPKFATVPVIGGSSEDSRVPILSQAKPNCNLSEEVRKEIIKSVRKRDENIYEAKGMSESINKAYANIKFLNSVFAGLRGEPNVIDIAMTKTDMINGPEYFSLPLILGQKGISKHFRIPRLPNNEQRMVQDAISILNKDADKAYLYLKGKFMILNDETKYLNDQQKISQQKEIFDLYVKSLQKNEETSLENFINRLKASEKNTKKKNYFEDKIDNFLPSEEFYSSPCLTKNVEHNQYSNKVEIQKDSFSKSNRHLNNPEAMENQLFNICSNGKEYLEKQKPSFEDHVGKPLKLALLGRRSTNNPIENNWELDNKKHNLPRNNASYLYKYASDDNYLTKERNLLNDNSGFHESEFSTVAQKYKYLIRKPTKRALNSLNGLKENVFEAFHPSEGKEEPTSLRDPVISKIHEPNVSSVLRKTNHIAKHNKTEPTQFPAMPFLCKSILQPHLEPTEKSWKKHYSEQSKNRPYEYHERFKKRTVSEKEEIASNKSLSEKEAVDNAAVEDREFSHKFYSLKPTLLPPKATIAEGLASNEEKEELKEDVKNVKSSNKIKEDAQRSCKSTKNILMADANKTMMKTHDKSETIKEDDISSKAPALYEERESLNSNCPIPAETTQPPLDIGSKQSVEVNEQKEETKSEITKIGQTASNETTPNTIGQQTTSFLNDVNEPLSIVYEKKPEKDFQLHEMKLNNKISQSRTLGNKTLSVLTKPNIFKKEGSTSNYLPLGDSFICPHAKVVDNMLQSFPNCEVQGTKKKLDENSKLNRKTSIRRIDLMFNSNKNNITKKLPDKPSRNRLALLNSSVPSSKHVCDKEEDENISSAKGFSALAETIKNDSKVKEKSLKKRPGEKSIEPNISAANNFIASTKPESEMKTSNSFNASLKETHLPEAIKTQKSIPKTLHFVQTHDNDSLRNNDKSKTSSQPRQTFSYAHVSSLSQTIKQSFTNKIKTDETLETAAKENRDSEDSSVLQKHEIEVLKNSSCTKNTKTKTNSNQAKFPSSRFSNNKSILYSLYKSISNKSGSPANVKYFKKSPIIKNKFYLISALKQNSPPYKMQNYVFKKNNKEIDGQVKNAPTKSVSLVTSSTTSADLFFKTSSYSESINKQAISPEFMPPTLKRNDTISIRFSPYEIVDNKKPKTVKYENEKSEYQRIIEDKRKNKNEKKITNNLLNSTNALNYYKNKDHSFNTLLTKKNLGIRTPSLYNNLALRKSTWKKLIEMNESASKTGKKIEYKGTLKKGNNSMLKNKNSNTEHNDNLTDLQKESMKKFDNKDDRNLQNNSLFLDNGTSTDHFKIAIPNIKFQSNNTTSLSQFHKTQSWIDPEEPYIKKYMDYLYSPKYTSPNQLVFDNFPPNEYNKYNNFPSLQHFHK